MLYQLSYVSDVSDALTPRLGEPMNLHKPTPETENNGGAKG